MELRWKSSLSATCMHAAICRRQGIAAADAQFAAMLEQPARELEAAIEANGWPVDDTLHELAGFSADIDNDVNLAVHAAKRLFSGAAAEGPGVARVAGAVTGLESKLRLELPRLNEELRVRQRPIREQWEARGPGLLHAAAQCTEAEFVPAVAEVVLVAPYAGGHGLAHLRSNRVLLEAVLANPLAALPETVRLAWLLCQLNGDLPRYAELLPPGRLRSTVQLATIPVMLAAAEAVELARCTEDDIALAIDAWRVPVDAHSGVADQLSRWWSAQVEQPSRWPIALAALAPMLDA